MPEGRSEMAEGIRRRRGKGEMDKSGLGTFPLSTLTSDI
jgi:hypothetical protein